MVSRLPYRLSQDGDDGVSQVPGGPSITCPASTTPVDPPMPGLYSTRDVAFPLHVQGRRPRKVISELFTQPMVSLSTLHPFGCPRGARLAPGWRPPLAGRDFNPQGPFGRFPRLRCHLRLTSSLPPSPGFAWRTRGTYAKSDFGALHTAYDLAVYASPLRLPSRR